MKEINIIISLLLIGLNFLSVAVFARYQWQSAALSSFVIFLYLVFSIIIDGLNIENAFKISLFFIFPVFGLTEFILAVMSPISFSNNGYIIGISSLLVFQIIMLAVLNATSKNIK